MPLMPMFKFDMVLVIYFYLAIVKQRQKSEKSRGKLIGALATWSHTNAGSHLPWRSTCRRSLANKPNQGPEKKVNAKQLENMESNP